MGFSQDRRDHQNGWFPVGFQPQNWKLPPDFVASARRAQEAGQPACAHGASCPAAVAGLGPKEVTRSDLTSTPETLRE